ncbi:MAG: hypothetical protein HY690_21000 [Chloroflexi bacterium]|nr:hypothetical protein [Chloroflexota bacterium]
MSAAGERRYLVTVGERSFVVAVADGPDGPRVWVDGQPVALELYPARSPLVAGRLEGAPLRALAQAKGEAVAVALAGETLVAQVQDQRRQLLGQVAAGGRAAARGQVVKAPMPGLVVGVPVALGETVARGASVVVLQAMKMENELRAAAEGKVVQVQVEVGQTVEQGQVLVVLE